MTGFGRGAHAKGSTHVEVEIRAVNHRGLDIKIRRRGGELAWENELAGRVRGALHRGAVGITVTVGASDRTQAREALLLEMAGKAREIKTQIGDGAALTLDSVLGLARWFEGDPGAAGTGQPTGTTPGDAPGDLESNAVNKDQGLVLLREATDAALAGLRKMRRAEGEKLLQDVCARLDVLAGFRAALVQSAPRRLAEAKVRLHERLSALINDGTVPTALEPDAQRVAQEVAVLVDKLDITEELVRLQVHLDRFRKMLDGTDGAPVGRKLDFLIQEIGRELNTVASKCQDAEMASTVVDAKAELEKIREQVQNIE